MFAIIDIETCGGKFEFRKGRIIEICILLHDGLSVVDRYSTLINPECSISPYFTNISGISNEMVADAPKFHEVAKHILQLTEDCIFVAHNVGFDYGFVREEFASLGYRYKRDTLCTVRLSRKLLPGKKSYSLGNLCEVLGIEIQNRHRAEGDALATAKLFDLLMQLKSVHPQYKNKGVDELMVRRIDKIKKYILDKIPESCGVYYFLDQDQSIIYIGKSTNMYNRAVSHFNSKEAKARKMLQELYNVDHVETGSELIALLLETEEIKKHKPQFNRLRKADQFTHSIRQFTDTSGIHRLQIVEYDEEKNNLASFTSYFAARERLEQWIDEYALCLRYCGLTDDDAVCFNHQIKKCRGICSGEENVQDYNRRMKELLKKYSYPYESFLIVDKGRNELEYAIVMIDKYRFAGYGYVDRSEGFTDTEQLRAYIRPGNYYPDADDLVRSWMKQRQPKIIPLH